MKRVRTSFLATCTLAASSLLMADSSNRPATPSTNAASSVSSAAATNDAKNPKAVWNAIISNWRSVDDHPAADNSTCMDCHAEYEDEKVVRKHVEPGVGCTTCHGASDRHRNDEDSTTAPDVMFVKDAIIGFCMRCHSKKQLAKKEQHIRLLAKEGVLKDKTCMDCHGKRHHIRHRMVQWDKTTGKLITEASAE